MIALVTCTSTGILHHTTMSRLEVTVFAGVVAVLAAILTPVPVQAGPKQAIETCMQQTGATQADLQSFVATGEGSQQLKCTLSCAMQKIKLVTPDGTIDVNYVKSVLPAALSGLIESCASKASSIDDVCQRSANYLQCFMSAEPKFFIEFISSD